jgi:hypothetical protein
VNKNFENKDNVPNNLFGLRPYKLAFHFILAKPEHGVQAQSKFSVKSR